MIEDVARKLTQFRGEGIEDKDIQIMFTAPGGAYEAQHLVAGGLVIDPVTKRLEQESPNWEVVYQSRSGSPQTPWLEPDVNDAIRTAHESRKIAVMVVPIGFVSDHVEVVWDLDNEAKETAEELGMHFLRAATASDHHAFVDDIADLILERIKGSDNKALTLRSVGR